MSSSKRTVRWRDGDVLEFLRAYKLFECLWNTKIPQYKYKPKRDIAYVQLRDHMRVYMNMPQLTLQDVKNKIKGLRTTYASQLYNITLASMNADSESELQEPTLFWYPLADSFLRDVTERRSRYEHEQPGYQSVKTENENEDETTGPMEEMELVYVDGHNSFENEDNESVDNTEHEELKPIKADTPSPRKQVEIKKFNIQRLENAINKLELLANANPSGSTTEDEFDLFGRSLTLQLRNLPEFDALELMQEIQSLVIEKRQKLKVFDGSSSSRKRKL